MDVGDFVAGPANAALRERGVESTAEPDAVRDAIRRAIDAATERLPGDSDVASVPGSGSDADVLLAEIAADLSGYGPLQRYFDDPSIEEIWINNPGRVFVARQGRSELTSTILTRDSVRDLVERMLSASGRRLDISSPFVDAALSDGSRLHVAIPDVTREHWAVNIRRFVVRARTVSDLRDLGMLSGCAARFLTAAVVSGLNVVVSGSTQAGKTTLLNALLGSVPVTERIVTCEETFELSVPDHPDWVALQTRQAGLEGTGEITLRRLVREALRMRPTRLVVGEVRQQEAVELLIAMNSGMPSMATIHANSAREAITKLCTLPLLAGPNITGDFVRPTVAACVDLVIHLSLAGDGRRAVSEIVAVPGRIESGVIELEPLFVARGGRLRRGDGAAPRAERFATAGYDVAAMLADDTEVGGDHAAPGPGQSGRFRSAPTFSEATGTPALSTVGESESAWGR